MNPVARPASPDDAERIAQIYNEGIADRVGTFETRPRTAADVRAWFDGTHPIVVVEHDGTVIAFDGYRQWAALQLSHDSGQSTVLVAAILMLAGLMVSLTVRRRRVWVRVRTDPDARGGPQGRTVVSVGGLARSDAGGFGPEFAELVTRMTGAAGPGAGTGSGRPAPTRRKD